MSGGTSVNSSIKLGTYAGRLAYLNLAGIKNPIPNLTTVYLDNPLVGPTPEPLYYVPSPGRLRQPSRYPSSSTRTYIGGARIFPPPPPPSYSTHPRMLPSNGWVQPRRGMQATDQEKNSNISVPRGEPLANFDPRVWRGITPPCTLTSTGGEAGTWLRIQTERQRAKKNFAI